MASLINESELETKMLDILKQWMVNKAKFNGRNDNEFLLRFLRGCKFDVEKTKIKLKNYYKSQKTFPHWWANKDPRDERIFPIIQLNVGPNMNNFDENIKSMIITMETMLKRKSSQLNGIHWVVDCKDYPTWFITPLLNPFLLANIINAFISSTAMIINSVNLLNTPTMSWVLWPLVRPFLDDKTKEKIHFYYSDWSELFDHIPTELIPNEYGGTAGSIEKHQDAFIAEILSLTDDFLQDDNYGYE